MCIKYAIGSFGFRPRDMTICFLNLDAKALYNAGEKKMGTDENTFIRIFSERSRAHLAVVGSAYHSMYGKSLKKVVKRETSGLFEFGLLTILRCSQNPGKYFAMPQNVVFRIKSQCHFKACPHYLRRLSYALKKVPDIDKFGSWYSNPGTWALENQTSGGGGVGMYLKVSKNQDESVTTVENDWHAHGCCYCNSF